MASKSMPAHRQDVMTPLMTPSLPPFEGPVVGALFVAACFVVHEHHGARNSSYRCASTGP